MRFGGVSVLAGPIRFDFAEGSGMGLDGCSGEPWY